jgi:predicted phage replisome organizer
MDGVKWIKLYTDMFEVSRKIKNIEIMQDGDTILIIWIKLLLLAGYVNDGGAIYLTPSIPFTEEGLANELRRPIETVRTALEVFECYDMIEIVDGVIYISSWGKYQNADKLEEIKAKDRERKRQKRAQAKACQEESVDSPRTVHGQSTEVPCIEEEEEKEKEKEFHSFIHAREEAKLKFLGGKLGKGVVMLSDEQIKSLLDELTIDEFNKYVEIVADAELRGKHYSKKTHYQAILDMVAKDRRMK